jgi:creatinine amidohydrolase
MTVPYLWGEMAWPAIDRAAAEGRVAIVPTACVEDHARHLPVDTDIRLCTEIVQRAAARVPEQAIVLPTISHGYDPHHLDFPGPTSVDGPTFLDYLLDVCTSVAYHGFKRILIVNGHGSNATWIEAAARKTVIATDGKALCGAISYWSLPEVQETAARVMTSGERIPGHAGEFETSLYLALRPDLVDMAQAEDDVAPAGAGYSAAPMALMPYWSTFSRNGVAGYARAGTAEKGQALLEAGVSGLARLITEFRTRPDVPRVDHHGEGLVIPSNRDGKGRSRAARLEPA